MPRASDKLPASYPILLEDIKSRIRSARIRAALSVNRELIELYWHIGRSIVKRQHAEGWGKSVVNLGFKVLLVSDATATFDRMGPDGREYMAEDIHSVHLASLHGEFCNVISTEALT